MLAVKGIQALALGLLMMGSFNAQAEEARPPVADKVVAYSGDLGTKVWTVRVGERSENQALVQVGGIDHDWNMRIQKMNVVKTAKDTRYSTEVNGKPYVALIVQNSSGELYLPGENQPLRIGYSETLSDQGNAQAFLTDYLGQK